MTSILPLSVHGLRYEADGISLIKDITFKLDAETRTIILGHNGAGKSLLLRLCHGLIAPTGGEIVWNGGSAEVKRRQAMVFQRPVMLRRTAAENVDYALRMRGMPRRNSFRHSSGEARGARPWQLEPADRAS